MNRTEISRAGGLAVPPEKRAFARDRDLARRAALASVDAKDRAWHERFLAKRESRLAPDIEGGTNET